MFCLVFVCLFSGFLSLGCELCLSTLPESLLLEHPWVYMCPTILNPPPHPSGLSQSTGFECPASCIELALAIYFTNGNIHTRFNAIL